MLSKATNCPASPLGAFVAKGGSCPPKKIRKLVEPN